MNALLLVLLSIYSITINAKRDIYDPYNIFCGSLNCYDILGIVNHDMSYDVYCYCLMLFIVIVFCDFMMDVDVY